MAGRFDARAMKLLPPGEYITDGEYPGLRFLATPTRRTWVYRYKSPVDGRMKQIKLGGWPGLSVAAAIIEWEKLRAVRDRGIDPAMAARQERALAKTERIVAARRLDESAYTVARLCDDYCEGYIRRSRAKKGADEVQRMFATMLGALGDRPAAEVTRADAFDLIEHWAGIAPVQAKKLRAELGAAWDYALDAGRLSESAPNWWRLIMRGKIRSKGKRIAGEHVGTAKRVLSPDELGALIRWLPNFTALVEDALTLYLWTGTRGAEIMAMEGREVRQEAGGTWWWTVPKAKTKNARHEGATDLRVPLFGRALSVALRRKALHGDGWLFETRRRDGRVTHSEQKAIQSAVYYHQPYSTTRPEVERPRLTVTHWAPHDLRRSARTLLASMGCPPEVGESVLGHMLPGVVGTYNLHAYDAERVEWLRRLAERLEGLAADVK